MAAIGLISGSMGPSLGALAGQCRTSLSGISFIFVAFPVGYTTGALVFGRLLDRHPGHRLLWPAVLLCSLTLVLTPLVTSLALLALVMVLMGFGQSGLDVGSNTLLGWVYGDKVGPYMNILHFSFGLGAITAPLVLAQSLKMSGGITYAFWILALLMLPVGFWLLRLQSPVHKALQAKARPKKTPPSLAWLFILAFVLYSGLELGYGNWISSYAQKLRLEDEIMAAYLASAFWGALTLGRLAGIPLAARWAPMTILFLDIAGCGIGVAALVIWPQSSAVIWGGTLVSGFSMASMFAALMTLAGRSLRLTGRLTSLFFIGSSAGAIVFPWGIGQGFESLGPLVMPYAVLGIVVLSAATLALLSRKI